MYSHRTNQRQEKFLKRESPGGVLSGPQDQVEWVRVEQAWFGGEGALVPSLNQALRFKLRGVALIARGVVGQSP
jgi:hypothetical protein